MTHLLTTTTTTTTIIGFIFHLFRFSSIGQKDPKDFYSSPNIERARARMNSFMEPRRLFLYHRDRGYAELAGVSDPWAALRDFIFKLVAEKCTKVAHAAIMPREPRDIEFWLGAEVGSDSYRRPLILSAALSPSLSPTTLYQTSKKLLPAVFLPSGFFLFSHAAFLSGEGYWYPSVFRS